MIEFSAELESVPPARPRRVARVLRVVDLAVLRQVRRQTEGGVRVRCVRESNVRRARRHVLDSALRETLTAGKLKEARAVADASLRYEVARPGARIVPTVLPVLRRHRHKGPTGDSSSAAVQCSVAVLIDETEEEAVFVANSPVAAARDLLVVKIVPHDTVYKCERYCCRCRAVGDRDVLYSAEGLRIASGNPVWSELLDRGYSCVAGERPSQGSEAGRGRSEARRSRRVDSPLLLLLVAAKKPYPVLQNRAAKRTAPAVIDEARYHRRLAAGRKRRSRPGGHTRRAEA